MESSRSVLPDPLSGVEDELSVHGVADLALERAEGFFLGLALGDLSLEVDASDGRRIADLGNGGHAERVVELTVPALGDPVNDSAARSELDRCRPVVGGEGVAVSEPANIAGIADELRGDDRTDSVALSERGARCLHGDSDPPV